MRAANDPRASEEPTPRARRGFTLLEVMLALGIAVLLLVALYAAINVQMRHAQAGRDVVEQSTLARSVLNRIASDVSSAVALSDSSRYRLANLFSGGTSSAGAGASTPASTPPAASGGSTADGAASTDTAAEDESGGGAALGPVALPLGVQGDAGQLTLIVSKVPGGGDGSDLRRVTYWLADGLARQESPAVTADNAGSPGGGDEAQQVIAREVRSLGFSYFDGSGWQDSWDSTAMGPDGLTPIGSPRAIAIQIEIASPGPGGREQIRSYRHVVAIPTANGSTQQPNNGDGTAP